MKRMSFSVPTMYCSACNMHLEGLEDELPGIVFIKASYQKQRMDIEFDETLVTLDEIRAAVEDLGHTLVDP